MEPVKMGEKTALTITYVVLEMGFFLEFCTTNMLCIGGNEISIKMLSSQSHFQ